MSCERPPLHMLTPGLVVHYNQLIGTHPPERCRAAIITQPLNRDGVVNAYVLPDGGTEEGGLRTRLPFDRGEFGGPCWHFIDPDTCQLGPTG